VLIAAPDVVASAFPRFSDGADLNMMSDEATRAKSSGNVADPVRSNRLADTFGMRLPMGSKVWNVLAARPKSENCPPCVREAVRSKPDSIWGPPTALLSPANVLSVRPKSVVAPGIEPSRVKDTAAVAGVSWLRAFPFNSIAVEVGWDEFSIRFGTVCPALH